MPAINFNNEDFPQPFLPVMIKVEEMLSEKDKLLKIFLLSL